MTAREHDEVLATVARGFPDRAIVVIGAAALRWHYTTFRGTLDLDLCIAIDLNEHGSTSAFPPEWTRQRRIPHRWRLPDGQVVDVLPAADSLLAAGRIEWPDGTIMDLTGIDLAMRDHHRYADDLPAHIGVASRRALFVAKVAAWLDRPADREKDLGDLALILDDYVQEDDPRRFDTEGIEEVDWSERPAFLLGMDLRAICAPHHTARVMEFSRRCGHPDSHEYQWLLRAAPVAWQSDESVLPGRLRALTAGLVSG